MNPNFTFDAEGVFDQAVKPLRPKRTRKSHWRRWWIALTNGNTLDSRSIGLRRAKLISTAYKPAGKLADEFLQRPRSPESEFGLRFEPPALRVELENFIGWMTAKGFDAREAEKEFFRLRRGRLRTLDAPEADVELTPVPWVGMAKPLSIEILEEKGSMQLVRRGNGAPFWKKIES